MSSQPPTTPRIDDLKARLRLDPKARHFYPLAEELRKLGQLDEAEKILRDGLVHHGTYLSAWVSLGRTLAEKGEHRDAVEALLKALALDPGNVVCARLLSTSYLALGEKVEALKKMKLVRAVMPGDEELDEQIANLEAEIAAPGRAAGLGPAPAAAQSSSPAPEGSPVASAGPEPGAAQPPAPAQEATVPPSEAQAPAPEPEPVASPQEEPAAQFSEQSPASEQWTAPPSEEAPSFAASAPSPFITEPEEPPPAEASEASDVLPEEVFAPGFEAENPLDAATPESGLSARFDEERPFTTSMSEEPLAEPDPSAAAAGPDDEPFAPEEPLLAADPMREAWPSESEEAPAEPAAIADDQTATLTMAELYAKQGHDDAAREIYERVLERDPRNEDVRARLATLASASAPAPTPRQEAAARLERWLEKVARREL